MSLKTTDSWWNPVSRFQGHLLLIPVSKSWLTHHSFLSPGDFSYPNATHTFPVSAQIENLLSLWYLPKLNLISPDVCPITWHNNNKPSCTVLQITYFVLIRYLLRKRERTSPPQHRVNFSCISTALRAVQSVSWRLNKYSSVGFPPACAMDYLRGNILVSS